MSKNVSLKQARERTDDVKKDPTEGGQRWVVLVHLTVVYWSSLAMIPERNAPKSLWLCSGGFSTLLQTQADWQSEVS